MIDSVLKGTGNSRFLKSAVPAGTSWADALAMLQAGTFPIDFNGINTDGFQQVGTPLNKANLLKDATAAQIGLPSSTTPNDMFNALAHAGDLHVWRKTVKNAADVPAGYTLGDVQTGNFKFVADSYRTFEFGTPSVDDAGNVGLNVEGSVNGRYNSNFDNLKGKFCRPPDSTWYIDASLGSQVIYIPADATFSQSGSYKYVDKYQLVTGYPLTPAGTTTTYPVSTNRNAYQEGDDAKPAGYTLGDVVTSKVKLGYSRSSSGMFYYYADTLSVNDAGEVSISTQNSYQVNRNSSTSNLKTAMAGKFIQLYGSSGSAIELSGPFSTIPGEIVFIPADTSFNTETILGDNYFTIDRYQPVTGYAAIPAGTTIEYLGCLGDKARVQVVSYVGTGTYGADNPNSLTFDFVPKVVMFLRGYKKGSTQFGYITASHGDDNKVVTPESLSTTYTRYNGFGGPFGSYAKKSEDGKTIFWYNEQPTTQGNDTGYTYYYLALG